MDYAAWKLFLDAGEFGSLSKVAMAYGTSQPHISRAWAANNSEGASVDGQYRPACQ